MGTLHKNLARAVLDELEANAGAIARRMAMAARDEVDEYAAVTDAAFADEVLAHAAEHVTAFVRAGRLGRPPRGKELDFVRSRGAQRAREMMPLDALLEAYLIGQRTVWEAIVDAAGDSPDGMRAAQELTALTFRYTHAINVAVADAYLGESNALATEAERGRRDLLDRLLSGREPGPDEARRAKALGLEADAEHVVAIGTTAAGEHSALARENAARLVVRALVRADPARPFIVPRHDEVVAVLPVYVRRGPAEIRAALERAVEALERTHGVRMRAGVSSVCSGLPELARGYGEAGAALRHAREDRTVVALQEIALLDYLAAGADETARHLAPAGARRVLEADDGKEGILTRTLRAYASCDLNVARTAEHLTVHPNTVHYRLSRIATLTGRDPRRFEDLAELLTGLKLLEP
ncbi:MAG TPA: helix-turn-helix domain-containing protein [Thermoleophilaceae bacterium]|nr:helix-turn-helix domain-containing protein [Thermoleophilaceae bacterium]